MAAEAPGVTQVARSFLTTRTVLAFGFGVLLILLALSGVNAVRVLSKLQSSDEVTLREFLSGARQLDEVRTAVYLSGTYVRDYLLEPDLERAEQSRLALSGMRFKMDAMLADPNAFPRLPDQRMYQSLKQELREYWEALDPVLRWTAGQRRREGYRFLRDVVLPRRSSTLNIADTIAAVNQQQLMEQDHRLLDMFSILRNRLIGALVLMFCFGFALACASTVHLLRLERQTLAHLSEVTMARQELRSLSAKLVDTQENERKSISRELHDAVGQSMSAVQFELHDLAVALAPYPEALRTRVDRIRELVESNLAMTRNMALLLRPSMLDDLGLSAALQWQAHQVARSTGTEIRVEAEDLPPEIPDEHKTCIFRLVQEALNNVCRHANADVVLIGLRADDAKITVTVQDNGRGFSRNGTKGLGLIGMQERVDGLGGTLKIQSGPGKGTVVEASLPLPRSFAKSVAPGDVEEHEHNEIRATSL
ncbi:Integral membrane sensor signal transduction histidine kinase [Candidatus Sulfopaludibacter sp. SbA4]|nr:Integral membrane sensor signal transduction histidine kinase [Candidatus Sulfopaludibacter sp. SbA4]